MVVRYGEKVMCNVEGEDGEPKPLTVAEFVQYSLNEDGLQLRSALHQRILDARVAMRMELHGMSNDVCYLIIFAVVHSLH